MPTTTPTIDPSAEQLARLAGSAQAGPVVMLNLLRFKEVAVGIDAADGISGAEAYGRYGAAVESHLERVGGRVLLALAAEESVIGPDPGEWDLVIAVQYPSRAAFIEMVSDPEYLAIHAHREAAVADSRLIACGAMVL
jgi:uncharacterized protein (DUF1330 family)